MDLNLTRGESENHHSEGGCRFSRKKPDIDVAWIPGMHGYLDNPTQVPYIIFQSVTFLEFLRKSMGCPLAASSSRQNREGSMSQLRNMKADKSKQLFGHGCWLPGGGGGGVG